MKHQIGVDGVARDVVKNHIGVDGIARNVINGYVGVEGVARQFFQGGVRWNKYSFAPFDSKLLSIDTNTLYNRSEVTCGKTFSLNDPEWGVKIEEPTVTVNVFNVNASSYIGWYYIGQTYSDKVLTKTVYKIEKIMQQSGYFFFSYKVAIATGYINLDNVGQPLKTVLVPKNQLPTGGTLIDGSVDKGYCVLKEGDNYYYYYILKEE